MHERVISSVDHCEIGKMGQVFERIGGSNKRAKGKGDEVVRSFLTNNDAVIKKGILLALVICFLVLRRLLHLAGRQKQQKVTWKSPSHCSLRALHQVNSKDSHKQHQVKWLNFD